MTKMPAVLKGLTLAIAMTLGLASSVAARAGVDVAAVNSAITVTNDLATAKFKIQVSNHEDATITSVRVVFAGGIEVALSDVAADTSATSGGQELTFKAADLPATKNVPVAVTVKFFVNGVEQSASAVLVLRRAE